MNAGQLEFTSRFIDSVVRQSVEFDPTGYDDGTLRRWVKRDSRVMPVMQLRPVLEVGTAKGVERQRDDLTRRQYGRDKGHSVLVDQTKPACTV